MEWNAVKLNNKQVCIIYLATLLSFGLYFVKATPTGLAYYMHDDAINISPKKMLVAALLLFAPAALFMLVAWVCKLTQNKKLVFLHYFISLVSITLLAAAINQPFHQVGDYMMVNFFTLSISFLLSLVSYVLTIVLFFVLIKNLVKQKTNQ